MSTSLATIAVVPRERFSYAIRALDNVIAHTPAPSDLLYIDGGSPPYVRRYVQAEAEKHGFDIVRSEHFLSPNQARNLAVRHVTTKYVVFIDNDAVVTPGWLDALVSCAEETGADVVGPLIFMGKVEIDVIGHEEAQDHDVRLERKELPL